MPPTPIPRHSTEALHDLIDEQIELVTSTGYGTVKGILTHVGIDHIVIEGVSKNIEVMYVMRGHIVTVWQPK